MRRQKLNQGDTMFAGRVIKKGGNIELEQPRQWFSEVESFYKVLDAVPLKAIEDLKKYELNRDIIIEVMRRCIQIIEAAGLDLVAELRRIDEDPFDGLEEDIAKKKAITGAN